MSRVAIYDSIGHWPPDPSKPLGGSEMQSVLLAEALGADLVTQGDELSCDVCILQRWSKRPQGIRAKRWLVAAHDLYRPEYAQHLETEIVCVSDYQADSFQAAGAKCIHVIRPILGKHVYDLVGTPKIPDRWIYPTAANKGLQASLDAWGNGAGRRLFVTSSGYGGDQTELCARYGVRYFPHQNPAWLALRIAKSEGVFYRNTAPECFPMTIAMARVFGCKFDVACRGHLACGIAEALEEHDLTAATIKESLGETVVTDIRIALAISSAPWIPGRVESLQRLRHQLGLDELYQQCGAFIESGAALTGHGEKSWAVALNAPPFVCPIVAYRQEQDRMTNPEWSLRLWKWAVEQDCTHCLFLQDDVRVSPDFWAALTGMIAAQPHGIIGLQTLHPMSPYLLAEGERWITTADCLVGVGYVWPRELMRDEFLPWRASKLQPGALEEGPTGVRLSEDTMQGLFALTTGRKIYHPMPTIIAHDLTIKSSYGHEGHVNRESPVTWERFPDVDVTQGWERETAPRHCGRFYETSPFQARAMIKGVTDDDFLRMRSDNGSREIRRMHHARLARGTVDSPVRIYIATPTRGGVAPAYSDSLLQLVRDEQFEVIDQNEIAEVHRWHEDVVRVRSRYVHYFLHQTDATHLLFIDSDIIFQPRVVRGMLGAEKDFVTAPYPRRDGIDFVRVRAIAERTPEAVAYRYCVRPLDGVTQLVPGPDGCVEIKSNGLGMTLLTRAGLQRMWDHYKGDRINYEKAAREFLAEGALSRGDVIAFAKHVATMARENPILSFEDESRVVQGGRIPSVALFQLMLREKGLLSEDISFCARWRDMGEKVWMYLGPGSPVSHQGEMLFRGDLGAFGLERDLG